MPKFLIGIVVGAALAFGYVRWGVALPDILEMPDRLRGNLVSTATEADLYDLDRPIETRRRALEVLFANRPEFAAAVDGEFGHPFLEALYRTRAIREARILRHEWEAFDAALSKPALRDTLEKKYGTEETVALKKKMLLSSFEQHSFLKRWIERNLPSPDEDSLLAILDEISDSPKPVDVAAPE